MTTDSSQKISVRVQESFDVMFERIKVATKTRTQMELATFLGVRQSSISDAKRRGSIPSGWFQSLMEQGVNPFWVRYGDEPMFLPSQRAGEFLVPATMLDHIDVASIVAALVKKISPHNLREDVQAMLYFKCFSLSPEDTVVDVLHKILPGNLATLVCKHIFTTLCPSGGENLNSDTVLSPTSGDMPKAIEESAAEEENGK